MKTLRMILFSAVAVATMVGCSSAFYASSAYDDMYYTHSGDAIAQKQVAEAEARKAEADARRAEALAKQEEWKAQAALYEAEAQRAAASAGTSAASQRVDSDGIIIVDDDTYYDDNPYSGVVANSYESAYARRLRGFSSGSYRMPSSYYSLRYGNQITYATAYDPAFYNIMVSGDEVWVEPKFITSMFGTWGAVSLTASVYAPWYSGWSISFDPWYYSWIGYPRYSWYDWNWNVCYGGGWYSNLWWGWGGYYRPWRPYYYDYYWGWNHHYYHHHYYPHHYHPVRPYNPRQSSFHHGSRSGSRYEGRSSGLPSRGGEGVAGRGGIGGGRQTPYRSPANGQTYGDATSRSQGTVVRDGVGSRGRGVSSGASVSSGTSSSRGSVSSGARVNSSSGSSSRGKSSGTTVNGSSSTRQRSSGVSSSSSSSRSRSSSYSSGNSSSSSSNSSRSRSSSYSSGSSSRSSYSGSSFSGGGSSRSGGGGSRSGGGSRGR
jgi:hypothetical protein